MLYFSLPLIGALGLGISLWGLMSQNKNLLSVFLFIEASLIWLFFSSLLKAGFILSSEISFFFFILVLGAISASIGLSLFMLISKKSFFMIHNMWKF